MNVAVFVVAHVTELGQAAGQVLGQSANVFFIGADVQNLVGFVDLSVDHLGDGLRPRNLKLELLPAHGLHQYR